MIGQIRHDRKQSGREREREREGGRDRERYSSWDSNTGHLKHNGAVCWCAAHKAIDANTLLIFYDYLQIAFALPQKRGAG